MKPKTWPCEHFEVTKNFTYKKVEHFRLATTMPDNWNFCPHLWCSPPKETQRKMNEHRQRKQPFMSDKCLPCIKCGVLSAFPQTEGSVFICLQCQSMLPTSEAQRITELESRLKEVEKENELLKGSITLLQLGKYGVADLTAQRDYLQQSHDSLMKDAKVMVEGLKKGCNGCECCNDIHSNDCSVNKALSTPIARQIIEEQSKNQPLCQPNPN